MRAHESGGLTVDTRHRVGTQSATGSTNSAQRRGSDCVTKPQFSKAPLGSNHASTSIRPDQGQGRNDRYGPANALQHRIRRLSPNGTCPKPQVLIWADPSEIALQISSNDR